MLVAETSRAMWPSDRKRQSQALNGLLAALPEDTQVDLLAVDWRVRTLAEAESPSKVREALGTAPRTATVVELDDLVGQLFAFLDELDAHARVWESALGDFNRANMGGSTCRAASRP